MLPAIILLVLSQSTSLAGLPDGLRANGGSGGSSIPQPYFTAFMSNPATECTGAAVTSTQGTAISVGAASVERACLMADGTYTLLGLNEPRVNNMGIQSEGARVNDVIWNGRFENAAWTKTNLTVTANQYTSPDNLMGGDKLVASAADGRATSTAWVPGSTSLTSSMFIAPKSACLATDWQIIIRDTSAGADRATCTGTTAATCNYARVTCNASGLTSANNHVMTIYPDTGNTGREMSVFWAQAEDPTINFASSPITTTATSVNRANENVTFVNPQNIDTAGCISATVTFGTIFGGGVFGNGVESMMGTSSSTAVTAFDGTNTVTAAVANLTGRTINILVKWSSSAGTMTVVADGVTSSGSFDGSFSSTATMRIGSRANGSGYGNVFIKNIEIGAHPLSCETY